MRRGRAPLPPPRAAIRWLLVADAVTVQPVAGAPMSGDPVPKAHHLRRPGNPFAVAFPTASPTWGTRQDSFPARLTIWAPRVFLMVLLLALLPDVVLRRALRVELVVVLRVVLRFMQRAWVFLLVVLLSVLLSRRQWAVIVVRVLAVAARQVLLATAVNAIAALAERFVLVLAVLVVAVVVGGRRVAAVALVVAGRLVAAVAVRLRLLVLLLAPFMGTAVGGLVATSSRGSVGSPDISDEEVVGMRKTDAEAVKR